MEGNGISVDIVAMAEHKSPHHTAPPVTRAAAKSGMKMEKAADSFEISGFFELARPEGFEPSTPWFVAKYSIQMSYGRNAKN